MSSKPKSDILVMKTGEEYDVVKAEGKYIFTKKAKFRKNNPLIAAIKKTPKKARTDFEDEKY